MDTGNFIKIGIGAAILLIVVVMVATPILDNVTYSETEENTPTGYATKNIVDGAWTRNTDGYTINGGETIPVANNDWILLSDTVVIYKWWNNLQVYDYATETTASSNTITISNGTWSVTSDGTTVSGSLGDNPIRRSTSGEIGTYYNTSFIINKTDDMSTYRLSYSTIVVDGENQNVRALVKGTTDSLTVMGITAGSSTYLDASESKAQLSSASIEEVSFKAYRISANPNINVEYTYNGEDHNYASAQTASIAGPLYYTVVNEGPIESMIGIVPLLMIAGIIVALIGALIIRRE